MLKWFKALWFADLLNHADTWTICSYNAIILLQSCSFLVLICSKYAISYVFWTCLVYHKYIPSVRYCRCCFNLQRISPTDWPYPKQHLSLCTTAAGNTSNVCGDFASGWNLSIITLSKDFCCYKKTFLKKQKHGNYFQKKKLASGIWSKHFFSVLCFFVAPGHFFATWVRYPWRFQNHLSSESAEAVGVESHSIHGTDIFTLRELTFMSHLGKAGKSSTLFGAFKKGGDDGYMLVSRRVTTFGWFSNGKEVVNIPYMDPIEVVIVFSL